MSLSSKLYLMKDKDQKIKWQDYLEKLNISAPQALLFERNERRVYVVKL